MPIGDAVSVEGAMVLGIVKSGELVKTKQPTAAVRDVHPKGPKLVQRTKESRKRTNQQN